MSDIDPDAMVRDQQERPHLYGPGAVEDLRDRLAAEARRLTESLDAARGVAEYLEDEVSVLRVRTIKAEAERDELRATVERVEALADDWTAAPPRRVAEIGKAARDLRAALHPQEPHTPTQDASSTTDGSEGAGSGNGAQIAGNACGDRLGTWHGSIGPCVLTGRHTLHDDGAGITWSRTNVPDLTGEP